MDFRLDEKSGGLGRKRANPFRGLNGNSGRPRPRGAAFGSCLSVPMDQKQDPAHQQNQNDQRTADPPAGPMSDRDLRSAPASPSSLGDAHCLAVFSLLKVRPPRGPTRRMWRSLVILIQNRNDQAPRIHWLRLSVRPRACGDGGQGVRQNPDPAGRVRRAREWRRHPVKC